jgi:ACS family glucarate transporter-like MFS transporter
LGSRRSPWLIVGLLSLTATAGYLCRVNLSTAGALLMEEFELTQVGMDRVFSAFLLGYARFQIPAGALLVLRFLLGVTEAPTYPGAAQGVARWVVSGDRGRANGLVMASIGIGSALAPPLVSQVMIRWGWHAALPVSALPALLVALVWRRVAEPSSSVEQSGSAATGRPGQAHAFPRPEDRLGERALCRGRSVDRRCGALARDPSARGAVSGRGLDLGVMGVDVRDGKPRAE